MAPWVADRRRAWHSAPVTPPAAPPAPPHWRQLPLPFAHAPDYGEADFLRASSNSEAMTWLARPEAWPQHRLALAGAEGSGKTHLLHIWAVRSDAELLYGPALRGEPAFPGRPVALDDADAAPERPLLHLINAAHEAGQPLLLTARTPPARWPAALPDLVSRLRATAVVEIRPAEDSLLRALLARLLAERQVAVAEPVQAWLRLRLPRTPAAMREAAARLDRVAMAAGRPITRAIAAAVLADLADEAEEAGDADGEESMAVAAAASPGPSRLL
jgi:chromosomal replication initiation ATPase DnaA